MKREQRNALGTKCVTFSTSYLTVVGFIKANALNISRWEQWGSDCLLSLPIFFSVINDIMDCRRFRLHKLQDLMHRSILTYADFFFVLFLCTFTWDKADCVQYLAKNCILTEKCILTAHSSWVHAHERLKATFTCTFNILNSKCGIFGVIVA